MPYSSDCSWLNYKQREFSTATYLRLVTVCHSQTKLAGVKCERLTIIGEGYFEPYQILTSCAQMCDEMIPTTYSIVTQLASSASVSLCSLSQYHSGTGIRG